MSCGGEAGILISVSCASFPGSHMPCCMDSVCFSVFWVFVPAWFCPLGESCKGLSDHMHQLHAVLLTPFVFSAQCALRSLLIKSIKGAENQLLCCVGSLGALVLAGQPTLSTATSCPCCVVVFNSQCCLFQK